jgi:hypothetical protein
MTHLSGIGAGRASGRFRDSREWGAAVADSHSAGNMGVEVEA